MIPFNIFGHTNVFTSQSEDPIVWVDASDISTYTLGNASGFGNELVVNGDFSDGLNNWNDNSGGTISIVNDKLVCNSSNGTFIFQSGVLDSSKLYKFTFEVSNYVSGAVYARSSPVNGVQYNQNGVYSDIIQGGNNKSIGGVNFIGTIDNISVKEILAYDVTNLDNKGILGGVMTLNGSVKFANGGFESWSVSDWINYNLTENYLNSDKDFTICITFNLTDLTSGSDTDFNYFLDFNNTNNDNLISYSRYLVNTRIPILKSNNTLATASVPNVVGVNTFLCTYDHLTNTFTYIDRTGNSGNLSVNFNSTQNQIISLLKHSYLDLNAGQNNPLHEFRLYNRAMSLVEMQDLQTELNNKYIILGNELVVNGDFATDSDWSMENGWSISGGSANCDGTSGNKLIYQNCLPSGANKLFRVEFEVLNYVSGAVYPLVKDENGSQAIAGITSNGVYTVDAYRFNSNSNLFYFRGVSFEGSIDNVSVKEILN